MENLIYPAFFATVLFLAYFGYYIVNYGKKLARFLIAFVYGQIQILVNDGGNL